MPVTLRVAAGLDGTRRVPATATLDHEAVTVTAGNQSTTLRYADLTRILFDGRWLHLTDGRATVALQLLRPWLPIAHTRRTGALARALQPVAGRHGARLSDETLARLG